MPKAITLFLAVCLFCAWVVSCAKITDGSGADAAGGGAGVSVGPTIFSVIVSTTWEGFTDKITQKQCDVPSTTAKGGTVTCTVSIPEGQVFFSALNFDLTVSEGFCSLMYFDPYYYQASTSTTFKPQWTSGTATVDCSNSDKAECFNGPAKMLVSSFPNSVSLYFVTTTGGLTRSYTAVAANTYRNSNNFPRFSNRWASNSLTTRGSSLTASDLGLSAGDGYVANSMQDWGFECRDKWLEKLATLKIIIADEDLQGFNVLLPYDQEPAWRGN